MKYIPGPHLALPMTASLCWQARSAACQHVMDDSECRLALKAYCGCPRAMPRNWLMPSLMRWLTVPKCCCDNALSNPPPRLRRSGRFARSPQMPSQHCRVTLVLAIRRSTLPVACVLIFWNGVPTGHPSWSQDQVLEDTTASSWVRPSVNPKPVTL